MKFKDKGGIVKKILFIPTYTYLSSPIFNNLLPELKEFETIYLDVEDQYQCEKTSSPFKSQFSKSFELSMNVNSKTSMAKVMKFFKMIRYKNRLKKLIKAELPSAIITTGDLTFSIRVIKAYFPNIPIFVIQPALFVNKGIPRKYSQIMVYILFNKILRIPIARRQNYFGQEYDDVFLLLWGEYFKQMIRTNTNIRVIGDITFDNFPVKKDVEAKRKLLIRYAYDVVDTKIVTICTSVLEGMVNQKTLDKLYEIYKNLILEHKDLFFIIKPHPRNNGEVLRNIFESLQADNCVILDTNLHELFKYTDIHISSFSRTAIEAIASEIPVISVNPNNEIHLQDFLNNQLNEKVTSCQEMHTKIEDILKNKDDYLLMGRQYIQNRLYKLDGNAAKRAVTIISREITSK